MGVNKEFNILLWIGHIRVHTHRIAWAKSEKTACDIHAGIKLRLSCTVVNPYRKFPPRPTYMSGNIS